MAPFGKIYSYEPNLRVSRVLIMAEMNGLEIERPTFTLHETNRTPEFAAKFPFGKIPAFEGADGFCIAESIAIATYVAKSGPKAGQLLGTDIKTQSLIIQWSTFAETELYASAIAPIAMVPLKYYPLDPKRFDEHIVNLERNLKFLEVSLQGGKKYLVGDNVTMADFMVISVLILAFRYLVDPEWRKGLPNVVAYVEAFAADPAHKKYYGELEMCKTRLSY